MPSAYTQMPCMVNIPCARTNNIFILGFCIIYIYICICCCLVREMVCCVLCMEKPFSNWNENFLCAYVQFWNATLVFHFGYDIRNGVVIHTSLSFYPHISSRYEKISSLTSTNHHWYIGWCHHLLKPQSFRLYFFFLQFLLFRNTFTSLPFQRTFITWN